MAPCAAGTRAVACLAAGIFTSCASSSSQPAKAQPVLYEISTRPWLYSLAQSGVPAKCGQYVCLRDVPLSEWQAIKDMSVDMVWLMGIWQLGPFGLKHDRQPAMLENFRHDLPDVEALDVIGSPYAIQNYSANPEICTDEDVATVRVTLNKLGMKLMLDFVPNHGAVDSLLQASHPTMFLQKPTSTSTSKDWWINVGNRMYAYGRGPYDGPWTDTLQYNYWDPTAVETLTKTLVQVASQADAIRCDMAMLILNDVFERTWKPVLDAIGSKRPSVEFWKAAIAHVRTVYPATLFMAEAYDYRFTNPPEKQLLQDLGFDVVYDKDVLDSLVAGNLDKINGYISSRSQHYLSQTAHFVENHDEQRSAKALGGVDQAFAGSVVASTIPGLRLFYFGQWDGLSAKLDVQLRRATAQPRNPAIRAKYAALLGALANDVFHTGTWNFIHVPKDGTGWRLSAWRWSSSDGKTKRLVVVNFSGDKGAGPVQVPDAQGAPDDLVIKELLSGAQYTRSAGQMRTTGLFCILDAWSAQIFDYGGSHAQTPLVV